MTDPLPWPVQIRLVRRFSVPWLAACLIAFWFRPTDQTFVVEQRPPVDLVLVIDDSGSMADEQAALAANLTALLRAAAPQAGVRVAVTTTTVPALRPLVFRAADDPRLLDDVKVGVGGSSCERGIDAIDAALDDAGLRNGAGLAVVVVSDEDDCGESVLARSADRIADVVGNRGKPLSFTVVTPGANRYTQLAHLLDGETLVLGSDWGQLATSIATDLSSMRRRFVLERAALIASVVVEQDGQALSPEAFSVSADGMRVALNQPVDTGAVVVVRSRPWPFHLQRWFADARRALQAAQAAQAA